VGYHEPQSTTPSDVDPSALRRKPSAIEPWYGPARNFSYRRYPYDPGDGRDDPGAEGRKVVRGGSWRDRPSTEICVTADISTTRFSVSSTVSWLVTCYWIL